MAYLKFYLSIFIVVNVCKIIAASDFMPEIQMPYLKVSGSSSTEIDMIGSTLTCDEQRNSLKDCATECYDSGCPGFYTDTTQNNVCFICHVSNDGEVQANSATSFTSDHVLYLLKDQQKTPEVSMTFDEHSGNTITGVGTTGTTTNVQESDYVSGIKNQALYLHDGGKVQLTGSQTQCWTHPQHCTSGLTVSIWYKPIVLNSVSIIACSGSAHEEGFVFYTGTDAGYDGKMFFSVNINNQGRNRPSSDVMITDQWYHFAGTFDGVNAIGFWINGVSQTELVQATKSVSSEDGIAYTGGRGFHPYYYTNGYVDEFMYYYRPLSSAEIWRQYIGYDIDLIRPDIITSPDLVSNGNSNDYNVLLDGNLATCLETTNQTCETGLKIKLWNSAPDQTNFTVTITTENINCRHTGFSGLMVYSNQGNVPNNLIGGNEERQHFLGNFDMLNLESETMNNGQNQCVFRHMCKQDDMCHYVFVSVQNVEDLSKICEVQFN